MTFITWRISPNTLARALQKGVFSYHYLSHYIVQNPFVQPYKHKHYITWSPSGFSVFVLYGGSDKYEVNAILFVVAQHNENIITIAQASLLTYYL